MKRIAILVAGLMVAACADAKPAAAPTKKLTGRQQDSVDRQHHRDLGESGIPGARAVTKAQKAADIESKRNNAIDTIH